MVLNRAEITAASLEIEFGGKKYRMSPLCDADFGEIERWLQDRCMSIAKRSAEGLPENIGAELITHAYDKACKITAHSPEASELLSSIEGVCRLIWHGIRHNHPDVSFDDVLNMATDQSSVESSLDAFDLLNSFGGLTKKKRPRPTQRSVRASKKAARKRKGK